MPKPTPGESRRHFIARCVIDDEARSDFPDADQRIAFCYSQYENKAETILIKNALDNKYLNAFDKQVDTIEDKNIKELTKYYQKNYNEGIKNYLEYGVTKWESLFTNNSLEKEYQKMYISIGNHIAQWYFRIFKTYISKADSKPYRTEWEKSFANYGGQVAATNVTGVSNTARKTLIKITQQLMRDPEFMILGEREKARILRSKFNHYSKFQAERLVRTESTRAANFAAEKSAKTLFSENDLSKRWLTIMDGRERPWHQAANGQTVPMSQNFIVGGEEMPRPGEGSARNVINCRCRILPIPVEGAIPVTELDDIGVSLGRNRLEDFSLGNLSNVVTQTIAGIGNELINSTANTLKELRTKLTSSFDDIGYITESVQLTKNFTLDQFNKVTDKVTGLLSQYRYSGNNKMKLLFKTTNGYYGRVRSIYNSSKRVKTEINFGSVLTKYKSHVRGIDLDNLGFDKRLFSHLDENNLFFTTPVHEMAHVLSQSKMAYNQGNQIGIKFWNEIKVLNNGYRNDLRSFRVAGNTSGYNDIYLGSYSRTNVDEFFAEAWTEYHLSSTPSKYASEVGKIVNKYYAK